MSQLYFERFFSLIFLCVVYSLNVIIWNVRNTHTHTNHEKKRRKKKHIEKRKQTMAKEQWFCLKSTHLCFEGRIIQWSTPFGSFSFLFSLYVNCLILLCFFCLLHKKLWKIYYLAYLFTFLLFSLLLCLCKMRSLVMNRKKGTNNIISK